MIRLAISGAGGKMGRRLLALAGRDGDFRLTQAIEWSGFPLLGQRVDAGGPPASQTGDVVWSAALAGGADVLVDFSTPKSAVANARLAVEHHTALVVGTTGLDDAETAELRQAGETIPVMHAPNFSPGVNLMFKLAAEAARALGDDYDIEIVEAHHNQKVDAPSGTALALARAAAEPLGRNLDDDLVHGRVGKPGKRRPGEIGMHALRMGALPGDHVIHFCSDYECLSITHRIESRDVLAAGALRAAKWVAGKGPGYFTMRDMLFAAE